MVAPAVNDRFCSNCRAELPPKATECPSCGVYAGDLYDERVHRPKTRVALFGTLLVVATLAAGAAIWWNARTDLPARERSLQDAPPVRVVKDRPGGVKKETEPMRLVRRHLVATTGVKTDCIALLASRAGVITAYDSCSDTRLGKWRVDRKTGAVRRAL